MQKILAVWLGYRIGLAACEIVEDRIDSARAEAYARGWRDSVTFATVPS